MNTNKPLFRSDWVALAALLIVALWLRAPFVSAGLPFFYQEDEAHHFNRVVNMVKSGSWDPRYFHKPSLHFYLRMPVVAVSFLYSVKKGYLRKLEEIQTKDTYGVGDYAFTVSHQSIVKWNRAFSLCLSLLIIVLVYFLARRVTGAAGVSIPFAAALPVAVSPDLTEFSAFIGVDTLMSLFCVASVLSALIVVSSFSMRGLIFCGIISGLAVSSKYNALPVMLIPLSVVVSAGRVNYINAATALLSPVAGFFLGSPFILSSLPLFLNQFGYEIWHYGIAGHEGHSAEPGFPQFLFYLNWLGKSAFGWGSLVLSIAGIFILIAARDAKSKIFLLFPLLFGWLMCMQRANFERNMHAIVPFLGVFASAALYAIAGRVRLDDALKVKLVVLIALLCMVQPLLRALDLRAEAMNAPESRRGFETYVKELSRTGGTVAVSGQLQMPPAIYALPRVRKVDQTAQNEDYSKADRLAVAGPYQAPPPFALERIFPGEPGPQRVVSNPLIEVYAKKGD